jgi:hypothetical protein
MNVKILLIALLIALPALGFAVAKTELQNESEGFLKDTTEGKLIQNNDSTLEDIAEKELSDEDADDLSAIEEDLGPELEASSEKVRAETVAPAKEEMTDIVKTDDKEEFPEISAVVEEKEKEQVKIDEKDNFVFDVGAEEKALLDIAKKLENRIPDKEWGEIATRSSKDKYVVMSGETLWRISYNLFGSGFYYSKVWSLNPYITNPHEIEPGMTLLFSTGTSDFFPEVRVGTFDETTGEQIALSEDAGIALARGGEKLNMLQSENYFNQFGDEAMPKWLKERSDLIDQGVFIQYASDTTYADITKKSDKILTREYERYSPPKMNTISAATARQYDETGFDKSSKISFKVKEGFSLHTFITSNLVQDYGYVVNGQDYGSLLTTDDLVYVYFNEDINVMPGDKYSAYSALGKVTQKMSDRQGYKYVIVAQLQTIRKRDHVWECRVVENSELFQRGDRVTVYTPKLNQMAAKTFNSRTIEAAVFAAYEDAGDAISYGDVIYLDRGRADGVEMGNVFEVYSFTDRNTGERITTDPTYKIGELTSITVTDNFTTAVVTNSKYPIDLGSLAISKTKEEAARSGRLKQGFAVKEIEGTQKKIVDEVDVELDLDDVSEDLLDKAAKIELSEDELSELEQQERDKSVIKEHEKDLKDLERLEKEIESAETQINEAKIDEDKFLEKENLEAIEKKIKGKDLDAHESVDELEQTFGKKFMDEDLNAKENPYGLTEFDLEEVDELLNTDPDLKKASQ